MFLHWFTEHRNTGFDKALDSMNELAVVLEITPGFSTECLLKRKNVFKYQTSEESVLFRFTKCIQERML